MENLDLREILKNVSKGTKLYSTTHGDIYLKEIKTNDSTYPIICCHDEFLGLCCFTKEGKHSYHGNGECVLFPSKENRDWSKFDLPCQFKIGDVICCKNYELISIYKGDNKRFDVFTGIKQKTANINIFNLQSFVDINTSDYRLATIDEEKIFYNNLKKAGYFWNSLTNSLEEYKFNIGDKIQDKTTKQIYSICNIEQGIYKVKENPLCYLSANYQNDYELCQKKFNITTLKPYDKVLTRSRDYKAWKPQLFSYLDNDLKEHIYKFVIVGIGSIAQCIPYKGNEHLAGTTNDCDEYYKTWE